MRYAQNSDAGRKAFYDKDYPVEVTEDATRQFIIRSGESYVQDMYLVAAEMDSGMSSAADAVPYGAGKCAGTSTFNGTAAMAQRSR